MSSAELAATDGRSRPRVWPAALLAAVVALYFADARLLDPHVFIAGIDVEAGHYWYKTYMRERLLAASLPLWNPHMYAGHPFLAYPEMCVFYPTAALFVLLPVAQAFTLNVALHVLIAGGGMYAFVRRFAPVGSGPFVAAAAYALGGYMAQRIYAGHFSYVQSAALLPWLAWAVEGLVRRGSRRDVAITATTFGLLVLAAPPHNAAYGLVLALVLALGLLWRAPLAAACRRRRIGMLAAAVGLGLLLAAVQVFPTAEFARESDRATTSYDFATFMSYPPPLFGSLVVPGLRPGGRPMSWEFGCDVGIVGLVLAITSLTRARTVPVVMTLVVIGIVAVTIMLGRYTPLYRLYYEVVPLLGVFRGPARAGVLLSFSLAALAGLAAPGSPAYTGDRGRFGAAVAVLAAAGAVAVGLAVASPSWSAEVHRAVVFALVLGLWFMVGGRSGVWRTASAVLVPAAVATELWLAHRDLPIVDARRLESPALHRLSREAAPLAWRFRTQTTAWRPGTTT